jgi:hypothetical protein
MYASIERTDEGEVVVGRVAQYVRAVEVGLKSNSTKSLEYTLFQMGMGKNAWVNNRMAELAASGGKREVEHVEYEEFQEIIWDIMEAGWRGRIPGEDEPITNMDIMHVFEKVDLDDSGTIDRNVSNWIQYTVNTQLNNQ